MENSHQELNLNETETQELFLAYEESFDEINLIPHEQVKQQHAKWLTEKSDL